MKIRRIVKMTFRAEEVKAFLEIFDGSKRDIRRWPGNCGLQLLRSIDAPHVLFTLSDWENEAALNDYRSSDFFKETWTKTRALFAEKAEAWSVFVFDDLD